MIIQEEEKVEIVEEEKKVSPEEFTVLKQEKNKHSVLAYILVFILIFIAILVLIFVGFSIYNYNNKDVIQNGVYISGINVSGLSKSDAIEKLTPLFNELENKDIALVYEDYKTYINPSEINLKYDILSAVNYAFNIGKEGNIFSSNYTIFETLIKGKNITPVYSINSEALNLFLSNLTKDIPNALVEGSYYIEGSKLIITKGSEGYVVDIDKTSNNITSSISDLSYLEQPVNLVLSISKPKDIDIEKIYKEVYKEPKDAYYTKNPYVVHPAETGVDFSISIDEAKTLIANSSGECEIKLKTTYPKITTNMIGAEAFPDLLATYTTYYNAANTDRVTNLKIAASKINGKVLLPGEIFSYNGVVGERTIAAGYKEAGIYLNGQEAMGLGGGICQISTTLFNAALYANLQMVEVNNHQFVPAYSSTGRDATVVYGVKDFRFKNTRKHAIKITCSVSGGVAKFSIFGVKEDTEYDVGVYVNINSNTSTYIKSTTYRTLKLNGKTISTEKIYSCTYKKH